MRDLQFHHSNIAKNYKKLSRFFFHIFNCLIFEKLIWGIKPNSKPEYEQGYPMDFFCLTGSTDTFDEKPTGFVCILMSLKNQG